MSLRLIQTIAKWTISEFFRSWIGWVSLIGFALLNGLTLSMMLWETSNPLLTGQGVELHRVLLPKYFSTMNLLLLMIIPALTMNSISGEQVSHRLRLYQTAPLSSTTVVLGKALGIAYFLSVLLVFTFPLIGILDWHADLNWMRWILGYVGTGLTGVLFISLGVWSSAHTRKPLTSWFLATSSILFLWFVGTAQGFPILESLSPLPKVQEYLDGWVGLLDTFYFFSLGSFLLYYAQDGLSAKRHPSGRSLDIRLTPVLWLVVLVMSNVLVNRYDRYWDHNDTRPFLSEESLNLFWNQNNPIELIIDLEESDFRYRQITNHLRALQLAGLEIPVTWLSSSDRPPGKKRGVTLVLKNDGQEDRTVLLTSLYPEDFDVGLMQLLNPQQKSLCFTQNGGEPSLFDGTSPSGFGLLTEELLRLDYTLNIIDPRKKIDQLCDLIVVAGRQTPIKDEWLDTHLQARSAILLLDPATVGISESWLNQSGVQTKDDFIIEVNPNFQVYGNPTTLLLSQYALKQHPTLSLDNQSLLLSEVRSVSRIVDNTQTLTVELLHASAQSWAETNYTSDTPSPDAADLVGNVPLLVEVSSIQSGTPTPQLMIMGTSSIIQNIWVEQNPNNARFFIQMLQNLLGDKRPLPDIPDDTKIQMTTAEVRNSTVLSILMVPGLIGIFGWWRRRTVG